MIKIVTATEMQQLDRRATAEYGIPSLVLMENAGSETAREMLAAFPALLRYRVAILCGRGNNGGDGFVAARHLLDRGVAAETFLFARREDIRGDARVNLEILEKRGAAPTEARDAGEMATVSERIASADLIVDALLGTGTHGAAQGLVAEVIELVNRTGRPVVAVDMPSGLVADDPEPPGPAVRATLTVTFALPKRCLFLYPAAGYAGTIRVVPIGIPPSLCQDPELLLGLLEARDVALAFPRRDPAAHKGTFGHVLVIAGSVGKTGAAALASLAALRVGAGLVTLAIPQSLNDAMEAKLTEVMTEPVAETEARSIDREALDRLLHLAEGKAAVALGPGLGTHPSTQKLVRELLGSLKLPIVLDADGINALAGQADLLARVGGPVIVTPHPGEFSRLMDVPRDEALRRRVSLAQEVAGRLKVTLVLKTAHTIVASPKRDALIVPTGNPGLATGGTGDVLTGLIAGLLAQGVAPPLAAQAGAYVHGLAGDVAAARLGQEAMLAGDVLAYVSDAIHQVKMSEGVGLSAEPAGPGGRSSSRMTDRLS